MGSPKIPVIPVLKAGVPQICGTNAGALMTPLLTTADLGQWLKLKEPTIRKKVCYNRIPFVRIGRAIRFRPEEIEAWLRAQNVSMKG